jgi:hypothetical protein
MRVPSGEMMGWRMSPSGPLPRIASGPRSSVNRIIGRSRGREGRHNEVTEMSPIPTSRPAPTQSSVAGAKLRGAICCAASAVSAGASVTLLSRLLMVSGAPSVGTRVAGVNETIDSSTGAMKRYPRFGSVSMKRGFSAESPRASRRWLIALFKPRSKSTNVSAGQSLFWSSSRETACPGRSSKRERT